MRYDWIGRLLRAALAGLFLGIYLESIAGGIGIFWAILALDAVQQTS